MNPFIVIENLTFWVSIFHIAPYLVAQLFGRKRAIKIYYIDGTGGGVYFLKSFCWLTGCTVEKLRFRLIDVRDEKGNLLRLRISYDDLTRVQDAIMERPAFQKLLDSPVLKENRLSAILQKELIVFSALDAHTLWRAIFLIQVLLSASKKMAGGEPSRKILFAVQRTFMKEIQQYADGYGVQVLSTGPSRKKFINLLQSLFGAVKAASFFYSLLILQARFQAMLSGREMYPVQKNDPARSPGRPRVMVDYYGQLNLDHPEFYSDLSLVQNSGIATEDLLVAFRIPADPLNRKKHDELTHHKIDSVVINPRATVIADAPVFWHWPQKAGAVAGKNFNIDLQDQEIAKWATSRIDHYHQRVDFWENLFKRYDVKMHVSWFQVDTTHAIIAQALERLGGISAIYQRSWVEFAAPEIMTMSDVFFGFSRKGIECVQNSKSSVGQYVITGYLGDHRFALLKPRAQEIRQRLLRAGAKKIIAFFDENSLNDERWHTGHELQRAGYRILLQKILENKELGLIIKPKSQLTLRRRLGAVAELLKQAEATGRCVVLETDTLYNPYPPALAALASDLAIHGHLCAVTAGLESALTGTPTLLVDLEGWPASPLYQLGEGRVVFKTWEGLWRSCQEHWRSPHGIPGFGDWSSVINEYDPFRDGCATQRMNTYVQWLLDGLKKGRTRTDVLADAAERYAKVWGKDKIISTSAKVKDHESHQPIYT